MIKPTFYNLPQEKREKIINVTKQEFSKGNKKKITINNVIEKAGISRGSFYQYFDDKLDLVGLVVDDMLEKINKFLINELTFNGGNIFIIPLKIFDMVCSKQNEFSPITSIKFQDNQNSDLVDEYMEYRFRHSNPFENIAGYVNTDNFSDKSQENVDCVVCMLMELIKTAFFNISNRIHTTENERKLLLRKIEIIRKGVLN